MNTDEREPEHILTYSLPFQGGPQHRTLLVMGSNSKSYNAMTKSYNTMTKKKFTKTNSKKSNNTMTKKKFTKQTAAHFAGNGQQFKII